MNSVSGPARLLRCLFLAAAMFAGSAPADEIRGDDVANDEIPGDEVPRTEVAGNEAANDPATLTSLATTQLANGALRDAEAGFSAAIRMLETQEGILSPRLIGPLAGLGETYIRTEQYALATQVYERALRVNHVNEGLYNLAQLPLRDGLTEGYLGQQDLERANFHQEAQVYVQQRKLGKGSPEMVAPLSKLGLWFERSNQAESAREVYQSAARLVENSKGENDPAMIEPLIAIAHTYRQQALLPPDPESGQGPESLLPMSSLMLRKALEVVDRQKPPDPAQRARVLVQLGDLYMMWGKGNTAADRYGEAWQELSRDEGLATRRDEYFAQPSRIMGPLPPTLFPVPAPKTPPPPARELEPGYVVVRYSVDALGRVSEASVIEADPIGLLESRVADTVRRTLFRPRHADGAAVSTEGLTLRHEFRYSALKRAAKPPDPEDTDRPLRQPGTVESGGG